MRKNRWNNGYIGTEKISLYDGSMAPSNFHIESSNEMQKSLMNYYIMPTDGGGYGATAFVGITNGVLLGVYIAGHTFGGTGYVTTTSKFIVSGGGGPYASGLATVVLSTQISTLSLYRRIKSIDVIDGGRNVGTPTVTLGSGIFSSSMTASISGTTLDVTAVSSGTVWPQSLLSGTGVASNTIITALGTGRGGTGTYTINNSQTLTSRSMTTSTTATATVSVENGSVSGINITYPGLYSTTYPTISFSGIPTDESFPVAEIYMENPSGYLSNPSITFINPLSGSGSAASGATALALVAYEIDTIGISAGGQNYSSSPTVFISGAENAFTETATVSGSTISQIQITSSNDQTRRFSSVPDISIGGWKNLPSVVDGEDKFVGTYAIYNSDNYVAFIAGQTYNVDWGDGTTGTFNSGATASKIYSSSVFAGITQNPVDGYKTVTIHITPIGGGRLTRLDFNVRHPSLSSASLTSQWLNMKMAGNTLSSITVSSATQNIAHYMLESFEFVGSPGNQQSTTSMFANCSALKYYEGKNLTINATSMSSMFQSCSSLVYVSEMNTPKNTTLANTFNDCTFLENAPKMDTRLVTSFSSTFNGCRNLVNVPLYDMTSNTTMSGTFGFCSKLKTVPPFNTPNVTTFLQAFSNCTSLTTVPLLLTKKATTLASMFNACFALKKVPKFNTSSCTSTSSMFADCYSIPTVPLFNTHKVTDMSSMFARCYSLKSVPNFDTRKVTDMSSMFVNCASLHTAPTFDMREVLTTANMFQFSGIVFSPQLSMPKTTTVSSMFSSCRSLRSVGNMFVPNCSTFDSLFSNCFALEYPPQIINKAFERNGSVSFMSSMFNNCRSLKKLPLMTTSIQDLGSIIGYGNAFTACRLVSEIPEYDFIGATGSANTTALGNIFSSMSNLSRIKAINFCQSFSLPNPNMMGATALNELYTNLAVVGASGANAKTLTVTGSLGVASDNISIATSKGWAITG
jgi:surface protein